MAIQSSDHPFRKRFINSKAVSPIISILMKGRIQKGGYSMGKGNAAVRQWIGNPERFADLFNGMIFEGYSGPCRDCKGSGDRERDCSPESHGEVSVRQRAGGTGGTEVLGIICRCRDSLNFIFPASCNGTHSKRLKRQVFHFFGLFSFSLFCYSIKGYYADTM